MLRPRTPVDAYRADLAGAPGIAAFGAQDGAWLLLAELLVRRAALIDDDDESLRALDDDLRRGLANWFGEPANEAEDAVASAVLRIADSVEEAGALQLANTLLVALDDAFRGLSDQRRGLILVQRARVARKAGAVDTANDLYEDAARLGRRARYAPVVVRSLAGQAVLARRRGNYPASRTLYQRALRVAERAGATEEASLAHHGLLIAASAARDFDTALRHGWRAFELVGPHAERQADLLGTLGAVAADAGHDRAALHAYLAAASRSTASRVRLPALAGAAVCAARLGNAAALREATEAVEAELTRGALPYEQAQALTLLSEAWHRHDPATAGEPYRARAQELARAHGFHEFALQAESLVTPADARAASAIALPTRRVLDALETLDTNAMSRLATVGR